MRLSLQILLPLLTMLPLSCNPEEELHKEDRDRTPTDVVVSVNPDKVSLVSSLQLSTTLTHKTFQYPENKNAVARAEKFLTEGVDCLGQFTMDWGAGNTNPSKNVYNYKYLDQRVGLIRRLDKKVILTLCRCPEWMRRDDESKGVDAAPRKEMYPEFAHMAADFIRHYKDLGLEIYAVNVWSETRGYWSKTLNRWELEDYADLYNAVYDSIKVANPSVLVGGPFMHIESSPKGRDMEGYAGNISQSDRKALQAFIDKARKVDFFSIDRNLMENADKTGYEKDKVLKYTKFNGIIHSELRELLSSKFPGVPVWVVDNQCLKGHYGSDVEAAGLASMFRWHLLGGASFVDKWQPEDEGKETSDTEQIAPEGLYTHTDTDEGAQPLPTFYIFRDFREHFPPGTSIVEASSDNEMLEVLASPTHIMLINKHSTPHTVTMKVSGKDGSTKIEVDGFEVKTLRY